MSKLPCGAPSQNMLHSKTQIALKLHRGEICVLLKDFTNDGIQCATKSFTEHFQEIEWFAIKI